MPHAGLMSSRFAVTQEPGSCRDGRRGVLPIGIWDRGLVSRVQFQRGCHAPYSTKHTSIPEPGNSTISTDNPLPASQRPATCRTGVGHFETPSNACSNLLRGGGAIGRTDRAAEIHASSSSPSVALTLDRRRAKHHLMQPPSSGQKSAAAKWHRGSGTAPSTDARRNVTAARACASHESRRR